MNNNQKSEISKFLGNVKNGLWFFGTTAWFFGITDRSIAVFSDGSLSKIDIVQLFTGLFFLTSWLYLKPTQIFNNGGIND
ncbi:hypothetical protein SD81_000235 [Tolypothrix campylonemoides VB511288]|nr:hypothetical protein SD81_000235 [Tolypothrix campylonemoides VB511288]